MSETATATSYDRADGIRYGITAAVVWPLGGILALTSDAWVRAWFGMPFPPGLFELGVTGWLEWVVLAPIVVAATLAIGPFRKNPPRFILVHTVAAISASIAHALLFYALRIVFMGGAAGPGQTALDDWVAHMDAHVELDMLVYVLTVTGVHAALNLRRRAQQERIGQQLQRQLAGVELELLKMHLPHDLLTRMLAHIETVIPASAERAEILVARLSRLLRSVLALTSEGPTLQDEMALAGHFAAVASTVRQCPFDVRTRVTEAPSSPCLQTKLMLPLLVAVWRDAAPAESPFITVDAESTSEGTSVIWNVRSVERRQSLRSLVENVRLRLSRTESIRVEDSGDVFLVAYNRSVSRDEAGSEVPASGPSEPVLPPRPPPIVLAITFLSFYGVTEAFGTSVLQLISAALAGSPAPTAPFAAILPAITATPTGFCLAWIAYRQRGTRHRYGTLAGLAAGALIGPVLCMTFFALAVAAFRPHAGVFMSMLRLQMTTSYRSSDLLVYFGIAVATLAYGRQFTSEERRYENRLLDVQLARTHAQVLKNQLNPHFLFNTLNSIMALLDSDRAAAAVMTARLRGYLGLVMGMAERQVVPLHEELELTMTYLEIEKVRFGDRLTVAVETEDAALGALVPNLLLQPLMENAVQHGLEPIRGGKVLIKAVTDAGQLLIAIRDNGRGARGTPRREGIGLRNVRNRLRQLHGDDFAVEIADSAEGYGVSIRLPLRLEDATKATERPLA